MTVNALHPEPIETPGPGCVPESQRYTFGTDVR